MILQLKNELDEICNDLGLQDIHFTVSPKAKNASIIDLTKHAICMLKIYKRHLEGDKTAPIREIFI
jgi:predicted secreted protein